jgi:hypothetical protein
MMFTYSIVKAKSRHYGKAARALKDTPPDAITKQGGKPYGIWVPQLGLSSKDLIVMYSWPNGKADHAANLADTFLLNLDDVAGADTRRWKPTVRPVDNIAPDRKGLYIHRTMVFDVTDVPQVVEMSQAAWATFESQFEARVYGFFQDMDEQDGTTTLTLVSWYRDYTAWEESRNTDKDPGSWEIFYKRGRLTRASWGISTSLLL